MFEESLQHKKERPKEISKNQTDWEKPKENIYNEGIHNKSIHN